MKNYVKEIIQNPDKIVIGLGKRGLLKWMSDEKYIKLLYRTAMHKKLNLDNPQTFNEKLQWLKLYNRNPLYTTMVDKYEVKKYIASTIGDEYVIPTLGIYDNFDDIDFNKLPDKFVIKCTHDSGGLVICKDKKNFDIKAAKKKINKCLKYNFFDFGREWPYKNVKPRILIEKYMEDKSTNQLIDYKFYCFNGYIHSIIVGTNRFGDTGLCFDFFDNKWNHLNLSDYTRPNAKEVPKKPSQFENMKKLATKLSADIPHVRVDFYEVDGKIYFGEMTFFDESGCMKNYPDDWDAEWGKFIKLPNKAK